MNDLEIMCVASKFGFSVRRVQAGLFLAPVSCNRFGHVRSGGDQMLVKNDGTIVVYEDDAQAFLAAQAVAAIAKATPS